MKYRILIFLSFILLGPITLIGQVTLSDELNDIDYLTPKKYILGGVTVSGVQYLDESVLKMVSGLNVGMELQVPGEEVTRAIENLWKQGLFENIRITATQITEDQIFLNIGLQERPRLSKYAIKGIKKAEADKIRDEIKLVRGDVVTDNLVLRTSNQIKKYYTEKGFLNTTVDIIQLQDTSEINSAILNIQVDKNKKVKIHEIRFEGNKNLSDNKAKSVFKETKEKSHFTPLTYLDTLFLATIKAAPSFDMGKILMVMANYATDNIRLRIFKASKFIEENYKEDLLLLSQKYNAMGFRDFQVTGDTIIPYNDNSILLNIDVEEGKKYYFRDITWVGNTKYDTETLTSILKIKKGDVYNQKELDANLSFNPNGIDVSSLYMDDGYLFFQVTPVEVLVENDSIDLELQIREGKQATINDVSILGNTRTNDHVIIREIRTRPGDMFSRTNIIRTTRELSQLNYFNAETITPDVSPNPSDGTVDISYGVEETSSDQVELSGGWGYGKIIGTIGVSFNNFSLRNMLKKEAWRPIPTGDGQKLSVRAQSYGVGYISFSASFTEPWLGGKRPNAFSITYYHSLFSNSLAKSSEDYKALKINSLTFGLGRRLQWPDDFFTLYQNVSLMRYNLNNYSGIFAFGDGNGAYNSISYGINLSRNSVDAPIYPRRGSEVSIGLEVTPPYSMFTQKDYSSMEDVEKYKWIEFHKWDFKAAFYQKLAGNLVVMARMKYGFLGDYNKTIGVTPFDRYYLGGDGLSGYSNFDGRQIVGMRGYTNESLTPLYYYNENVGGTIYNKNTIELRYPLSLNPSATIYALAFLEAGNSWLEFKDFDPFTLYRSAGIGVRIFLPMFGVLGLDWGYGFDDVPGIPSANKGQFHFSINGSID
ncbi:MAG: POTRA domain-containing protein [Bacteroidales bacterium]|nr:POTRA domain-containing protein [Bacteroidales bacterium]MDD3962635.1 POTRA domain-containing protein [Bacteroidales bacterium]MDY0285559.1 POTRA domain-containing protein [Bacteroidales bacterium]